MLGTPEGRLQNLDQQQHLAKVMPLSLKCVIQAPQHAAGAGMVAALDAPAAVLVCRAWAYLVPDCPPRTALLD